MSGRHRHRAPDPWDTSELDDQGSDDNSVLVRLDTEEVKPYFCTSGVPRQVPVLVEMLEGARVARVAAGEERSAASGGEDVG